MCVSVGKPGEDCANEDAAIDREGLVAVADGAGGGGLFADKWSEYLLRKLPAEPLCTAEETDGWLNGIWEEFYDRYERVAQKAGGLLLNKFYDEGSFATLAAVWKLKNGKCRWACYGDSVAFHYNRASKRLEHSFGKLADFDEPPFLINCKDELDKEGFRAGEFEIDEGSVVFVASDALSHYVLMMYEVMNRQDFEEELHSAQNKHSKNENYIKTAMSLMPFDFEEVVIDRLLSCVEDVERFTALVEQLTSSNLAAVDDYSLAVL